MNDVYQLPSKKLKKPSNGKTSYVLISCGSFCPPTILHTILMEHGKDYIEHEMENCECLGGYLSPAHNSYEKKTNLKDKHRLNMAKLAVEDSKWIDVDDWEFTQESYSTTIKVLKHFDTVLKKNFENCENINIKASLICGADLLQSFNVPNLWLHEDMENILKNHEIFVLGLILYLTLEREGVDLGELIFQSDMLSKYKKNIHIMRAMVKNDVSSTKIRLFIKRDYSIKYLIHDKVIDYINENKLFK